MKIYKIVGFLNMFEIIPNFVYPIFEYNNKLYLHEYTLGEIKDFIPLHTSEYDRVIYLIQTNDNRTAGGIQCVKVGDRPVIAIQVEESKIVYDNPEGALDFLINYHCDNDILMEEIEEFKNDVEKLWKHRKESGAEGENRRDYGYFHWHERKQATIKISRGNGNITINNKNICLYRRFQNLNIRKILALAEKQRKDIEVYVNGELDYMLARSVVKRICRELGIDVRTGAHSVYPRRRYKRVDISRKKGRLIFR